MIPADPSQSVPVAIIGMGCMFPEAENVTRFWANIRHRLDAIREIPESHWKPEDYFHDDPKAADRTYARRGGFLLPVDFPLMEFGIAPNTVEATDTTQLLGLLVARQALEDAGYGAGREFNRDRASVILGVTGTLELVIPLGARLGHPIWRRALEGAGVDKETTDDVVQRISDSYVGWQENSFPGLLGNVAAGRIANKLDLGGTNCVVDAACASSLAAINLGMLELAAGRSDVVISGGLDTFNDIFMYMCFSKTPALSASGDARPFDAASDGTILGEGLGIVVLKRLEDAQRDGDRIYAVIRSMGTSSDGKGQAVYAPVAKGQAKALRQAYEIAGITPDTVELLEAHGTGTKVGDGVELSALEQVYQPFRSGGSTAPWCALGSVKSQVGHTKAAAGAAGLIKAALALHHKVLPPTIKVRQPIESLSDGRSPFYLNGEDRPWLSRPNHPRRAAVSAFGFGGSNFHCVLEEASPVKSGVDWDGDVQIIPFSSDDPASLRRELLEWPKDLSWNAFRARAAECRRRFQPNHAHRLVLVAERDKTDLAQLFDSAINGSTKRPPRADAGFLAEGQGARPGPLAVLCPGQGSQYLGMLRELACQFPEMQESLALADAMAANPSAEQRLSDRIYPQTRFRDADRQSDEQALRETQHAQPAIGAVSLGLLKVLESFGIRGELTGGHSYGELTALRAAGWIDDRGLAILSQSRGVLMAGGGSGEDSGSMIAVQATSRDIEQLLRDQSLDLVLANRNAPTQNVLSGSSAEVRRAAKILEERGIGCKILPVSRAFHSRFVARAERPFRDTLDGVAITPTKVPVYANTTATTYPADPEQTRRILAAQLSNPVNFVGQIEAMYQAGARVFLELGPDAKLSGLVRSILKDRPHTAIAVDASRGEKGNITDLARALASLAAQGFAVDFSGWDRDAERLATKSKPGLTVKVCGAHPVPKPQPVANRPTAPKLPKPETEAPRTFSQPIVEPSNGSIAIVPSKPALAIDQSQAPHASHVIFQDPRNDNGDTMKPTDPETTSNGTHGSHAWSSLLNGKNGHHPVASSPGPRPAVAQPAQEPIAPAPISPRSDSGRDQALRVTQENLISLQKLAEQTALLHGQFLEGQEQTQRTLQTLLDQQWRLLTNRPESLPSIAPVSAPAPVSVPAPKLVSAPAPAARLPEAAPVAIQPIKSILPIDPAPQPAKRVEPPVIAPAPAPIPAPVLMVEPVPVPIPEPVVAAAPEVIVDSRIAMVLLEVVSEKTGYPSDMLELEMSLDADLGIDSIKRVEILSALQDRLPGCPAFQPDQLSSIRTLRNIVELASPAGSTSIIEVAAVATPAAPVQAPAAPVASEVSSEVASVLLEVVSEKTGYPSDMLELEMSLDADLGIDSIKRVEILSALQDRLPGCPSFQPDQLSSIRTLRNIVELATPAGSPPMVEVASVVAPTAPAQAPAAPVANEISSEVASVLLEVVSEKTGYPSDMLELEMSLDADLGIDSIKRVEILSALQDRLPGCPAFQPDQLSSIRTLRNIVELIAEPNSPALASPVASVLPKTDLKPELALDPTTRPQCYVPMAVPFDLGRPRKTIQLPETSEIWIVGDDTPLTAALRSRLEFLGQPVRVHGWNTLRGTTIPDQIAALIFLAPGGGLEDRLLRDAFGLSKRAGASLKRAAGVSSKPAFLTVSTLDGHFGLSGSGLAPSIDPRSGALAGLSKTARLEWPEVQSKALDIDPTGNSPEDIAAFIVDELLHTGPVEVGLCRDGAVHIKLEPEECLPAGQKSPTARTLNPRDVVVISGGARGVTAEVAVALASAFQPTIILLGRTPEPNGEPDWLGSASDELEIKKAILQYPGSPRTPQAINDLAQRFLAQREITRNIARIVAAGGRAYYHSVDVMDAAKVQGLLRSVQTQHGPIRGLIHGAGVLADRKIEDLGDEQFSRVFDTKIQGLKHLFESLEPRSLKLLALFSSSTARFGRIGQVAYAAANENLNKWAQRQGSALPDCFVASFNWGPWDGGMVTAPLKQMFEEEGLGLIPLEAGARLLVDRFRDGGKRPVEVVVLAGELPREVEPPSSPTPAAAKPVGEAPTQNGQTLQTVMERAIDLESAPILHSHVIDGHAVVPIALIQEWLCEAALQRNPGLVVRGLDDLRLLKGIVLRGHHGVSVQLRAGKPTRRESEYVVPVELIGKMASNGREVTHARADVILADRLTTGSPDPAELDLATPRWSADSIYGDILFHGSDFQGIVQVEGQGKRSIAARVAVSPPPSAWFDAPLRRAWLTDPLAIDCAIQLVILWGRDVLGVNSLPTAIGSYRQYRRAFPTDGVRVVARIRQSSEHRVVAEMEFLDAAGHLVARIDSYECVLDSSLNQAFRRNRLTSGEVARVS